MRITFAGSFAKIPENPETNEDFFVVRELDRRIVICDGASESYDSRAWAKLLAEKFSANPAVSPAWVEDAVTAYNTNYDANAMSWSKQAAFERGSFSTLLVVEVNDVHDCVEILAIGDSIAILVDNDQIVASWPYTTADQFAEHPSLLSTLSQLNMFIDDKSFNTKRQISWRLKDHINPILLCMTDALGQWVLRLAHENNEAWKQLLAIDSLGQLANLVLAERAARRMRTDDSTLVVVRFSNGNIEA